MTTTETAKIMATLWAAYPGFYSKAGNGDQAAAVELWQKCFEAEPYEPVSYTHLDVYKRQPHACAILAIRSDFGSCLPLSYP